MIKFDEWWKTQEWEPTYTALNPDELQPCGHPIACVVSSDEGTSYCGWCADVARLRVEIQEERAQVATWMGVTKKAQAQVARLREALEELSDMCSPLIRLTAGDARKWEGAVRKARTALSDTADESTA